MSNINIKLIKIEIIYIYFKSISYINVIRKVSINLHNYSNHLFLKKNVYFLID